MSVERYLGGGVAPQDFSSQLAQADQMKRLASLEDLMRGQENTVSNMLARMQELELGVTNATRQRDSQFMETFQMLSQEVAAARRRIEEQEHAWRLKNQEVEAALAVQGRAGESAREQNQETYRSEVAELRQYIQEVEAAVRRVDSQLQDETRQHRLLEQDAKWIMEHYKELFSQHGEALVEVNRKLEGVTRTVGSEAAERERLAASMRQAFEESVQALSEQTAQRVQQEVSQRLQLAQDTVSSFRKFRDEVNAGFERTSAASDDGMRSVRSVETILRAEIRARMEASEEQARRLGAIDERTANDAQVLAQGLRDLDEETTAAIRELRESVAAEYRSGIEQVARRVGELQQLIARTGAAMRELEDGRSNPSPPRLAEFGGAEQQLRQLCAASVATVRDELAEELRASLRSELQQLVTAQLPSPRRSEAQCEALRRELSEMRVTVQALAARQERSEDEARHQQRAAADAASEERRALTGQAEQRRLADMQQLEQQLAQLRQTVDAERRYRAQAAERTDADLSDLRSMVAGDSLDRRVAEVARVELRHLMDEGRVRDQDTIAARLEQERRAALGPTAAAVSELERRHAALERRLDSEVASLRDDARRDHSRLAERFEDLSALRGGGNAALSEQLGAVRRGLELEQRTRAEEDVQLRALIEGSGRRPSESGLAGPTGVMDAAEFGRIAFLAEETAAKVDKLSQDLRKEALEVREVRRLLEDQVKDSRAGLAFGEEARARGEDKVASTAEALHAERAEREREVERLEGQVETLQRLCVLVKDTAVRERETAVAEVKLYVDERLSQTLLVASGTTVPQATHGSTEMG